MSLAQALDTHLLFYIYSLLSAQTNSTKPESKYSNDTFRFRLIITVRVN